MDIVNQNSHIYAPNKETHQTIELEGFELILRESLLNDKSTVIRYIGKADENLSTLSKYPNYVNILIELASMDLKLEAVHSMKVLIGDTIQLCVNLDTTISNRILERIVRLRSCLREFDLVYSARLKQVRVVSKTRGH